MKKLMQLWKDEEGATMVEYGVMVALIAAVSIIIITTLGQNVLTAFTHVADQMPDVAP